MTWHGETIVNVTAHGRAATGPVYERPVAVPAGQEALAGDDPLALPRPATAEELREPSCSCSAAPNLADKAWVTTQYD